MTLRRQISSELSRSKAQGGALFRPNTVLKCFMVTSFLCTMIYQLQVIYGIMHNDVEINYISSGSHMTSSTSLRTRNLEVDYGDEQQYNQLNKNVVIFYNTFINQSHNSTMKDRSLGIIREQLDRIRGQSLLADKTIYYSRIGDYSSIPFPDCNGPCEEIIAQDEGDEEVTLQALYDYCVVNDNHRVVYMHSKGTFTPTETNDNLRNVLTAAVTSNECLNMDSNKCNVCSTQFQVFPIHYVGNMWVGDCSYIKELIPPKDFANEKLKVVQRLWDAYDFIHGNGTSTLNELKDAENSEEVINSWLQNKQNTANSDTYLVEMMSRIPKHSAWVLLRPPLLGIGRFAMEHWIGSHPKMKPCEAFGEKHGFPKIEYLLNQTTYNEVMKHSPVLQESPQNKLSDFGMNPFTPWQRGEGRSYEYEALYGQKPNQFSWFTKFFCCKPSPKCHVSVCANFIHIDE